MRQNDQITRRFIEHLSKYDLPTCQELRLKMTAPLQAHAQSCMQTIVSFSELQEKKLQSEAKSNRLKEKIKTLDKKVESLEMELGEKYNYEILMDQLKRGLYSEANSTASHQLKFIGELVEYHSLKKITKHLKNNQQIQEQVHQGSPYYKKIKKYLLNQKSMVESFSKQIEHYLSRIKQIDFRQASIRPKYIGPSLLGKLQGIQRQLLNKEHNKEVSVNRLKNMKSPGKMKNEYNSLPQESQEQFSLKNKLLEVKDYFLKKLNLDDTNSDSFENPSTVQAQMDKQNNQNRQLQKRPNKAENNLMITSLYERVSQLENILEKLTQSLIQNINNISRLLGEDQVRLPEQFDDVDKMLTQFEALLQNLYKQHGQMKGAIQNLYQQAQLSKHQISILYKMSVSHEESSDYCNLAGYTFHGELLQKLGGNILALKIKLNGAQTENAQWKKIDGQQTLQIEELQNLLIQKMERPVTTVQAKLQVLFMNKDYDPRLYQSQIEFYQRQNISIRGQLTKKMDVLLQILSICKKRVEKLQCLCQRVFNLQVQKCSDLRGRLELLKSEYELSEAEKNMRIDQCLFSMDQSRSFLAFAQELQAMR